jgi:hypothetical protein
MYSLHSPPNFSRSILLKLQNHPWVSAFQKASCSFLIEEGFSPLDLDRTCLDGRRAFLKILIEEGFSYGS